MSTVFKLNTLLSAALAGAFYLFFMFAKHDPGLSTIAPFVNDPYDAIGSFAAISSALLVIIACVRAFRPYRRPPTEEQRVFLIRTHLAIALAALITMVADSVALARHPSMWLGSQFAGELLALPVALLVGALAVVYLIRRSMRGVTLPTRSRWVVAAVVAVLAVLILSLYPEQLIQTITGHLFTIFVGIVLLFAPMAALDMALAPFVLDSAKSGQAIWQKVYPWLIMLLFALVVGLLVFLGESREGGGGIPLARFALVFGVFVGAGTIGVLIGYAFLRKPLGLLR